MADTEEYGDFEKEKPAEQVKQTTEEVKSTVKEDKGKSVRDRARDFKQQAVESLDKGQEKIAPVFSAAKEKLDTIQEKRPEAQQQAKEMLDQAKHTVGRVVQQESKDVVEGVKRLAQDEKAFHEAAHKVAEKVTGKKQNEDSSQQDGMLQRQQHVNPHHIQDFSDFSEIEDEFSDEGEGSSNHPKKHLLHQHDQQHPPTSHHQKRKKSPIGYFKFGAKYAGKEKTKGAGDQNEEQEQQGEHRKQDSGDRNHGLLGTVRSVFGQGSHGQNELDIASNLAQKKLGQMRHVVDAQMDEGINATAAEKKTQGVGLVQSFVCLCTCASSVHVTG